MFPTRTHRWVLAAMVAAPTSAHAGNPQAATDTHAPEVRLEGETISLPIMLVRFYPFIDANIEGISGKVMLDTGALPALAINDHRVHLSGSEPLGTGNYGSGQHFETRINAQVENVRIASLKFPSVSNVESHDATQLERITPDFVGWFGYGAFQGYSMKLDYDHLRATFYRSGSPAALAGESVLGKVRLQATKRPGIPSASGRLGDIDLVATFDTGQNASLFLDDATKLHLVKTGALSEEPDGTYTVRRLTVDGWAVPPIQHLEVSKPPAPYANALGLKGPNMVSLGYALLRHHPTLWDFDGNTIYILKNR